MDYDRGQGSYEMARPLYPGRPAGSGGTGAGAGAPYYPRVGTMTRAPPPLVPSSSFPSGSAGSAIKVAMKPQYRVGPPAQLRGQSREVPRSLFQFEFDLERRIIAEAESNPHHQVRLAGTSGTSAAPAQASNGGDDNNLAQVEDATVAKYLAMGHNKESIQYALQTYGDDQTKILDFCPSYNRMREMGFSGDRIARALASFDNDVDPAIQSLVGAL